MEIMVREYEKWVESYCTPLGLDRPVDVTMVKSWHSIFRHAGYTMGELNAARDQIMRNPPEYRTEHLKRIHESVAAARSSQLAQDREDEEAIETYEACKLCQGTGWVEVPHPRYVKDGKWLQYPGTEHKFNPTAVVCCRCHRGERQHGVPRKVQPQTLENYEQANPNWESQMATWHEAQLAERRAHAAALDADKSLGKLLAEVGQALPPEPEESRPRDTESLHRERLLLDVIHDPAREQRLAKEYPQTLRPAPHGHNQVGLTVEQQIEKMMTGAYEREYRASRDAKLIRERQAADLVRREQSRKAFSNTLVKKKPPSGVKVSDPAEGGLFDDDTQVLMRPLSDELPG